MEKQGMARNVTHQKVPREENVPYCATSVCVSAQRGTNKELRRSIIFVIQKAEVDQGKVQAGLRGSVALTQE